MIRYTILLSLFALVFLGCQPVPWFPDQPAARQTTENGMESVSFDTNKDRHMDYRQVQNSQGRIVELHFSAKDQPEKMIRLDQVPSDASIPHYIIALDGVPFDLVRELYDQGHFRLFYPPSRVISCFPGMTDLAFQRIFGGATPLSYEAEYFDRSKNHIVTGNEVYLSGKNADWANILSYRCSFLLDAAAYIAPKTIFNHELSQIYKTFQKTDQGTSIGYSVAAAGLGTRGGRESILQYLRRVDRLCEQMVYERQGQLKISLLADHGHNLTPGHRISFRKTLKEAGFRVAKRLKADHDVVPISYGLVTYAAFYTHNPAPVADALLASPAAALACYPTPQGVCVRTRDGSALISYHDGRYRYAPDSGDPLQLNPILDNLRQQGLIAEDGFIEDRVLLDATQNHIYPDPLRRIWLAFHGLVQHPADLIVCLHDGWYHGSASFDRLSGGAVSTHGSLNQINSTTFLLTMTGPLPPALRLEEIMPALQKSSVDKMERR